MIFIIIYILYKMSQKGPANPNETEGKWRTMSKNTIKNVRKAQETVKKVKKTKNYHKK